jgi:hypothetical protein
LRDTVTVFENGPTTASKRERIVLDTYKNRQKKAWHIYRLRKRRPGALLGALFGRLEAVDDGDPIWLFGARRVPGRRIRTLSAILSAIASFN